MKFAPDDILIANGYLAKGDSTIFCGAPGIGKSRLYMQMLLAFVTGQAFLGWETQAMETKWLVMQTENSNRRLNSELTAMCSELTRPQMEMVTAGIRIHTLELPQDSFLSLSVPENEGAISEVIQEFQPTGIVFDVLRDFAIGDLNTDGDMTATLSAISRITRQGDPKRIPIVIHHALTGKTGAAKATGFERGGFGRNSKVLTGWARAQINITPYEADSNEILVISSGKANNTEEFTPFCVALDSTTMTYHRDNSIDLEEWKERVGADTARQTQPITIGTVVQIVERAGLGGIKKCVIARELVAEGAPRPTAYRLIEKAEAKKAVIRRPNDQLYVVPKARQKEPQNESENEPF
jgi:RecA-family ATPase